MKKHRSPTRKPIASEFLSKPDDICIGLANLKYCPIQEAWVLPAGQYQGSRYIKSRPQAVVFATRLHEEIQSQNDRLGIF